MSQSHFSSTEEQAHGKTDVLRESISELSEYIYIAPEDFLKEWKKLLKRNKEEFYALDQ